MKRFNILFSGVVAALVLMNCSSDDDTVAAIDAGENTTVLVDFSTKVAASVYTDLGAKTTKLKTDVSAFTADQTDEKLTTAKASWKSARETWEQSEAHLFGPVATDEIDPRIDTWPVNFVDLDAQLNSENEFTASYINGLDDALKGFHPIEYLLFGKDGDKTADEFTEREIEYLTALTANLQELTAQLATQWSTATPGNYVAEVSLAGKGSAAYKTQVAAFEEIVSAMAGICDEVANGKLAEPYDAKNPELEESPFSGNSIIDFTNNIKGVKNVYTGKFVNDGAGLDDLVKKHNLSLDAEINAKIDAAITSLGNITVPFGRAITEQSVQVENAMAAIDDLRATLDEKLLPFVKQHSN